MSIIENHKPTRTCPNGFLSEYLEYSSYQESPEDFHYWVALGVLSSCIGRSVFLNRGYFNLYPNLYIVLVAPSGILHKSTAMNMGITLLRDALPERRFFAQKLTPPHLIKFLYEIKKEQGSSQAMIHSSEFAVLLGKAKLDPDILYILTDLYDCPEGPWTYGTISRGEETPEKVFLSMLAGTTPDWIKLCLPEDSLGGGFASRLIFIPREVTDRKFAFPEDLPLENVAKIKPNLIQQLRYLNSMKGEFRWTDKGKEYYNNWYHEFHRPETAPKELRGYFGRKDTTIIKIAMLLSLDRDDSFLLDETIIFEAHKVLSRNEKYLGQVLQQVGQTESGKSYQRVLDALIKLTKNGERAVQHSILQRYLSYSLDRQELIKVLVTLKSAEMIKLETRIAQNGMQSTFYELIKKGEE